MPRLLLAILMLPLVPLAGADVVISAAGAKAVLTEDDARDLLLGKRSAWKDGTQVVVVMVADAQQPALERLTHRSASQVMQTWKRMVFTGQSSMPVQCA